jgi:hypothetical protein
MTKVSILAALGLMSASVIVSPGALAQVASSSPDPNAKVCQVVSQVGSRLSKKGLRFAGGMG